MMPRSWQDVLACDCPACGVLKVIYRRCLETAEPLYVADCRMFDAGFRICDSRKVFNEPATDGREFASADAAAVAILKTQMHCDGFVSSWPIKPAGRADFVWERRVFV